MKNYFKQIYNRVNRNGRIQSEKESISKPEEVKKKASLKERTKVEQTPEQKAYQYVIGLKQDEDYKNGAKHLLLGINEYIRQNYPGIQLDTPKMREKSPKSCRGKIKRLEIERLAKLYAIEGINQEQQAEFIEIVKELAGQDEVGEIVGSVENLLQKEIGQIDIQKTVEDIVQRKMNAHSKTALLRILKTKIENSDLENKKEWLEHLEAEYGEPAAIQYDDLEKNLLRSENMEEIKHNPTEIERIRNPEEYLKVKDIMAMRFVFTGFPENYISENKQINAYLEEAKKAETSQANKRLLKDKALIEFEKEFARNLLNHTELLQSLGFEPMPNAYKHKNKANGYVADHLKLRSIHNPEHIVEVQFRTIYREELARCGEAAHDQRPGKARKKPSIQGKSRKAFMEEVMDTIPKYTIIADGQLEDCSMYVNTISFLQDYIKEDEEDLRMLQTIKEEEERCRA